MAVRKKTNLPKFDFRTHKTALWPMEQPSILSGKFDYPVIRLKLSLSATAHNCELVYRTLPESFQDDKNELSITSFGQTSDRNSLS